MFTVVHGSIEFALRTSLKFVVKLTFSRPKRRSHMMHETRYRIRDILWRMSNRQFDYVDLYTNLICW